MAAAALSLSLSRRTAVGVTTDLLQALLTAASARVPVTLAPAAQPDQTSELRLVINGDNSSALTGAASIARYVSSVGHNQHLLPADPNALKVRGKVDQMLDFAEATLAPQVNAGSAGLLQSLQYLDAVLHANTPAAAEGKRAPNVLSFTGAHHVTVADVAVFAAVFPLLSPGAAASGATDAAAGANAAALAANAASFARVSAWFERLRTFELKDSLQNAFAAAAAAGAHSAAAAASPSDKKQKGDAKAAAAAAAADAKVVLVAGDRKERAFQPVAAVDPNDVFDIAWAPRIPVGHTAFSWKRGLGAAIAAATSASAPAHHHAAHAPAPAAAGAGAADAGAAGGDDAAAGAGAKAPGKRAEKTAAKAAAFKEKEALKAKRAEEEAKKKADAAAAGDKKEAKSKGRIKPKAGDAAAAAGAGAGAQQKTPEDPVLATGFVGASAPPKRQVLPIAGKRNILITSALPYVNNVPHLGNIIGCVLSADVYARFCRLRGHNTLYICGTDEYGTATETKAILDKVTPKELCDRFHVVHRDIYQWFNIGFDHFGRTTTPQQTSIAQDIFKKCDDNKLVSQDDVVQLYCETCKRFLADRFIEGTCPKPGCGYEDARGDQCDKCGSLLNAEDLIKPKCKLCSTPPVKRSSRHLFLDLNKLSKELEGFVGKSSVAGAWSANSTQVTKAWLKDGLQPRCISRDLKWGTPVPKAGFEDKVFYVWFDAPIGYISITANYTDKWQQWWKNQKDVQLYQFMGKDNIPFHTVIFPSTLLATREPYTMLHHISTCEYLNYESGKFSKSRGTGVFGDDAVKSGIPSEVWRYYLLASRPESSDSTFLWDQFTAANNNELLASLGNYVQRSLTFVKSSFGGVVPRPAGEPAAADTKFVADVNEQTALYVKQLEAVQIKEALRTVMKIAAIGNTYTQHTQPWVLFKSKSEADKHRCQTIVSNTVHAIRWLAILAEPFMPTVSHKICQQLNIKIAADVLRDPTPAGAAAAGAGAGAAVVFDTNAFAAGHAIGDPVPIFREIKAEERDDLKSKFQGKQDAKEVSATPFPLATVVGVVKSAAAHEKPGLVVVHADVGEADTRLCVSAIGATYPNPQALVGRRVVVLTNIKAAGTPKVTGALLCADAKDAKDGKAVRVLLTPADGAAAAGAKVAPKGVKLAVQPNFQYKTALPALALGVDAKGHALYGVIPLEANGAAIVADNKVANTNVSI